MNRHLKLATIALLLLFVNTALRAQNYQQMIKLIENDRENRSSSVRQFNDYFGYSVAISGDYAIVGAYQEDEDTSGANSLYDAGAAYIFFRSGGAWSLQQKIVASDRATNDYFGRSVAISGDYAIVGAFWEDEDASGANTSSGAGSAYIFVRSGSTWSQQQKIVASDRAVDDNFGGSVAISGDYAIVGASQEDEDVSGSNTLNNAGSAYIFARSGSTWTQQQKIVAGDRAADDYFGSSVSISGDYAIVGAYWEAEDATGANTASGAGSAYVFFRNGSTWSQQQKIVASDRGAYDFFGYSVAISGDYAIVGAYTEDEDAAGANTANSAGSAYIFARSGSTWSQQQKIVASDRGAFDNFGKSVAISADYAIVGAYGDAEDTSGANSLYSAGSAYVFIRNGSTWSQQQKIVASDRGESDAFGWSVAISGDYAVVGAFWEDEDAFGANTAYNPGSSYIFARNGNAWNQQQKIVASDRAAFDNFGYSVAVSGNYAIVGAYDEDEDASGANTVNGAGAAYIFFRNGGIWSFQQKVVAADRGVDDQFGYSVSISGDYAIIGAHFDDEDASGANTAYTSGSAYIFARNGSSWTQQQKIVASDRAAFDNFGWSVAISGDYAIVGAHQGDKDASGANTLNDAGSAYIFVRSGSTWSQQQKIVAGDRGVSDNFGWSVSISGDYAIVGAYQEDENVSGTNTLSDAGSAYIFIRSGSSWSQQQKIVASDRAVADLFGCSVAISGDYAIVGAHYEDEDASGTTTLPGAGSAYIFVRSGSTWSQQQKIVAGDRNVNDNFGWSVAISGDYAVVGAYGEDEDPSGSNSISSAGSAYIFARSGSTWAQQQKIVASDRGAFDNFGWSVSLSGGYALVSAPQETENALGTNTLYSAGSAYMFEKTSAFVWTGVVSNDYNVAGNWSSGSVPSSTDAVIFPSVTPFTPNLNNTTFTVSDFIQYSGQTLSLGSGNMNVTDSFANNGTITGAGRVVLNGTSAQSITGTGTVNNFELDNSNGASVGTSSDDTLKLTGLLTLSSGTLTTNNKLLLKSSASNQAAMVGPVPSGGAGITGNVIHERYLSAPGNSSGGRSWRLLTSPLANNTTDNSIFYHWQNNGVNDGTGIELFHPSGTGAAGNGLATGGASSSIRSYDAANNVWLPVTNTKTTNLFTGTRNNAYLVFAPGHYGSGNIISGSGATNSDATGTLVTGTQIYDFTAPNATSVFQLIGNPYACPIDFDKVWNNGSTANIERKFWVIDPSLNSVGGYVTVSWDGISAYTVAPVSSQNQYIQTGQGFFVQATTSGVQSTVVIEENDKETTAAQTAQFRTNGGTMETFRINLKKPVSNNWQMIDGTLINGHQSLSNSIAGGDAVKLGNFNENISIWKGNNTWLAIEGRQLLDNNDTVKVAVSNLLQTNYQLEFVPGNMNVQGLTATLIDNFTNTTTPVSLTANTVYSFSVTSNAASQGTNRFKVVFQNTTPLDLKFLNVRAEKSDNKVNIDWTVSKQEGIHSYEVERSNDGKAFSKLGSVSSEQKNEYSFSDETPNSGNNYYRIKAIARSATAVYSNIVRVNMNQASPELSSFPNPATGSNLQISLSNLAKGTYYISLHNASGQKAIVKQINYEAGAVTINMNIENIVPGIYLMQLTNEQGASIAERKIVRGER